MFRYIAFVALIIAATCVSSRLSHDNKKECCAAMHASPCGKFNIDCCHDCDKGWFSENCKDTILKGCGGQGCSEICKANGGVVCHQHPPWKSGVNFDCCSEVNCQKGTVTNECKKGTIIPIGKCISENFRDIAWKRFKGKK